MLRSTLTALCCAAALGATAEPLRLGGDDWCPYLCPQTPEKPGNRKPIEIGEIGISQGTLYLESQPGGPVGTSGVNVPTVIEKLDASVGVSSDANELKVDVRHVALRGDNPRFGVNDLSGIVRRHEDSLTIENLSLRTEETSLRASGSAPATLK